MKFIKLTDALNGEEIRWHFSGDIAIRRIDVPHSNYIKPIITSITAGFNEAIHVLETPEEIIALIEESNKSEPLYYLPASLVQSEHGWPEDVCGTYLEITNKITPDGRIPGFYITDKLAPNQVFVNDNFDIDMLIKFAAQHLAARRERGDNGK